MFGDGLRTRAKRNHALEIPSLVFVIRNSTPIPVAILLAWPPASSVPLRDDAVDAVGREESVLNSLSKAVFIDRITKIDIRVARLVAQRRRRHAELVGRLKVGEDLTPGAVLTRAAAVALVHDDQVEEVRCEGVEEPGRRSSSARAWYVAK